MKTRSRLCLTALLATLAACSKPPPEAPPEPPAPVVEGGRLRFPPNHPQLALLTTTEAAPPARTTIDLPARLVWNEARTQRVTASFAGRVSAIDADVGQSVRPGDVLARLVSREFGSAQADVVKAQADAALAHQALARQRELYEAGIAPRKEMEQAEADAQRAGAELARARQLVGAYGGAAAVNQQLALRAALGGVVVERHLNPGQELRPDAGADAPPLFVISDPGSLWVQIDAREAEAGTLEPDTVFSLLVPSLGERRFEGRIAAVAPAIDPATRTVKVRGVIDNPERLLRAEMLAIARIERMPGAGVLVPAQAVALRGGRHTVFVQTESGVFEPRTVTLAWQSPTQAVVRGIEVGERVVSSNMLLLARQFDLAAEDAAASAAQR